MDPTTWFWASVVVLAVLLFFPVSNLVWVASVRRAQRRLGRELDNNELAGQKNRARFIAFFISLFFSCLFCLNIIGLPNNG
jgi:dolichol kinase